MYLFVSYRVNNSSHPVEGHSQNHSTLNIGEVSEKPIEKIKAKESSHFVEGSEKTITTSNNSKTKGHPRVNIS